MSRHSPYDVLGPGKIVSFLALFSMMTVASWAEVIIGLAWIVDGDTLEINGITIRLHGIDAPEKSQRCKNTKGKLYRCGETSTEALKKITKGERVTCSINGRDRYGRLVGTCYIEREVQERRDRNPPKRNVVELNSWLVKEGYALAYRRYSTKYVKQEIEAKTKGRGIWKEEFTEPWRWRRGDRLE